MRLFHVWVTFNKGGNGYPIKHYSREVCTSVQTAAARGVADARKKYSSRFRVVTDAKFYIEITAGEAVEKEAENVESAEPECAERDGGA